MQKPMHRVRWGGALGSESIPSMLMRHSHFSRHDRWKSDPRYALGAGGLPLSELEEHPAKVYKGYFDLRRSSRPALRLDGTRKDGESLDAKEDEMHEDVDDLESVASTISSMSGNTDGSEAHDDELRTEPFALRELIMPGVKLGDTGAMWIARWLEWQHHLANEPTDLEADRRRREAKLPPSAKLAPVMLEEDSSRPGLRKLALSKCIHLTDIGVAALALAMPHASSIRMDSCPRLTSFAVVAIARRCSELKSLSIRGCELVDGRAILALSRLCPFLETLQVVRCPGIKQPVLLEAASRLHRVWMGIESSLEVLHEPARKERIGSRSSSVAASQDMTPASRLPFPSQARHRQQSKIHAESALDTISEGGASACSGDSLNVIAVEDIDDENDDCDDHGVNEADAFEDEDGNSHERMTADGSVRGSIDAPESFASKSSSLMTRSNQRLEPIGSQASDGRHPMARIEAWIASQTTRKGKDISGVALLKDTKAPIRSKRAAHEGLHWTSLGMQPSGGDSTALQEHPFQSSMPGRLPGAVGPLGPLQTISSAGSASVVSYQSTALAHVQGSSPGSRRGSASSSIAASGMFGPGSPELLIITPQKGLRSCPPIVLQCFMQRARE